MTFSKNIKIIVNYIIGPLIMLFLFYSVARQLEKQPHWKSSLERIWQSATGTDRWKLFAMTGLMIVNWSIESLKWKIAIRPIQKISFVLAFKAILAGTCIASFTPNRVGEYLGRMIFVQEGNKIKSVAPTVLCSMSQMLVTLTAGSLGLWFYASLPFHFPLHWLSPAFFKWSMLITAVSAVLLGLVYFGFDPLVRKINILLTRKKKNITLPEHFKLAALSGVFFLSMIRYGVFILQYFLLFSLFGIPMSGFQVFTGVSVMFVLMAIVPTLTFLTDLGFRWAAGIQIFQVFTGDTAAILAVSLGIWLINLIIPALIGSLLILRIKLFSTK